MSGKYASPAIKRNDTPWNVTLNNLEIRHANTAVDIYSSSTIYSSSFSSPRIIYCTTGFYCSSSTNSVSVQNACFNGVTTQYSGSSIYHTGDTTCSNNTPTLNDINDKTGTEDSGIIFSFVCNDVETPGSLTRTATSSNQTLIPNNAIIFGGSGVNSTLALAPESNQSGSATITVSVSDGTQVQDTFVFTVNAVNDPPVISNLATAHSTYASSATAGIQFKVSDVETTDASQLTLEDPTFSPAIISSFSQSGTGANRLITMTPADGQFGPTTVTLNARDPQGTLGTSSFTLNVMPDSADPDGFSFAVTTPGSDPISPGTGLGGPNSTPPGGGGGMPDDLPCPKINEESLLLAWLRRAALQKDEMVVTQRSVPFGERSECGDCAYYVDTSVSGLVPPAYELWWHWCRWRRSRICSPSRGGMDWPAGLYNAFSSGQ